MSSTVEVYERIWLWVAAALIVMFVGAIGLTVGAEATQPPSHVETVDPAALDSYPEFADPKVTVRPDGSVVVSVVAGMFSFSPDPIEVPTGRPVTFRLTSRDVVHGFMVSGTNANAMVMPGYVTQFTYTFNEPGEYPIACNEYCGIAHHMMVGKLIVKRGRP
jgi:cytochrome c oxidase subunit 2